MDSPESIPLEAEFNNGMDLAMGMNPDLQRARLEKEQAKVRYDFARNQRLPELNLTAGIDMAGHGVDWSSSNADIEELRFPGWSAGVVLRWPIWGDVAKRNEYWAAKLRYREAERVESNLMTQLKVGSDTSEHRLDANYMTAQSLMQVVDFREKLLQTRMQARDVGRMDARSVLEAEQELFVAKLEQLQSEVECQRALLEMQLISGALLQMRGIEISFEALEHVSKDWARDYEEKTPDMKYTKPDTSRMASLEPVILGGDPVGSPWLGFSWGGDMDSERTPASTNQRDRNESK
jgi:outer membrane protein TolC